MNGDHSGEWGDCGLGSVTARHRKGSMAVAHGAGGGCNEVRRVGREAGFV